MVSTNADYIKATESSTQNKSDLIEAGPASMENVSPTLASTKHTLCDFPNDLVCSTSKSNLTATSSSKMNKNQLQATTNFSTAPNLNVLSKPQGQRWQQYFDFEIVLKQLRHAEVSHFKMLEVENCGNGCSLGGSSIGCGGNSGKSSVGAASGSTNSGATLSAKAKLFKHPQRFQVQRLNGNDMHYYSLAPKHQALEIVVCNACKGIYTIVGFSNHMMRQHPAVWSSVPSKSQIAHTHVSGKVTPSASNTQTLVTDIGTHEDDQVNELDRIELVGVSSDSSAAASSSTSSSSTSSSQASSFGSTPRAAKGNRNIGSSSSKTAANIIGNISSNGRSRSKSSKNNAASFTVISTTATSTSVAATPVHSSPVSLQSATPPFPGTELLLSSLTSTGCTIPVSKKWSTTTPAILSQNATTPAITSNVTAKVLPTFGIVNGSNSASVCSKSLPAIALSSFSNSSSNSSTSSSCSSSTTSSSKMSSQSTTPSPSLFPLRSIPLTDISNNETGQFEIVSSTTAYYMENLEKGIQCKNKFSKDSFEKTDDNTIITSISDMRDLTENVATSAVSLSAPIPLKATSINHISSVAILQNVEESSSGKQLMDASLVSDSLSKPKVKYFSEQAFESSLDSSSKHDRTDTTASESLISSSVDILQPVTPQSNGNSITAYNSPIERLQMSTVSTSGISSSPDMSKSNSYYNMTKPNETYSNNKINLDKVCGVVIRNELSAPCMRPLTCSLHTQAAKRQVTGRNKPFDELLLNNCASKEEKHLLPVQDVVDSSNSSSSTDFERRSIFGQSISSASANPLIKTSESNLDSRALNSKSQTSANYIHSDVNKSMVQLDTSERGFSAAPTNSMIQQHQQCVQQNCVENVPPHLNSSDESSLLTLEGIFGQTTQLDMLSSKFITEILNTNDNDINFDDLDSTTNTTQITRLLHQPAAKRLRLNDNTVQDRTHEVDNESAQPHQQLEAYLSEQTIQTQSGQSSEHKSDVFKTNYQQQQKEIEIQYQTDLGNALQQQEQITAIEAMQFQQLLYQQCAFNTLEATATVLEQHRDEQIDTSCLLNSKGLIELTAEEKCYSTDNSKAMLENYSSHILSSAKHKVWSEYNIDDADSSEAVEWRFDITQMPSLTDDTHCANEISMDSVVHLSSHTQTNSTEQYTLPSEDELLFEITADNQVSIINSQQQQQVIAEILTQTSDYNTVAQMHSQNNNNNNLYVNSGQHINKKPIVSYDFSTIETLQSFPNCIVVPKSKNVITSKSSYDDVNFNVNIYNFIPRPLAINCFGLMKLPITFSTSFRKDLLTARKVNNNPITFSGNVHTMNSRFNSGNSLKLTTHTNSGGGIAANVSSNSGHHNTNLINEFSIGSITVTANVTKQQKNGTLESSNTNPSNSITSTNGNISPATETQNSNNFPRNQQKSVMPLTGSLLSNNFSCLNGKNKVGTASTSIAPIAIVNPTSRLSTSSASSPSAAHVANSNSSNIINNSSHLYSLHRTTSINYNVGSVGTDRVKLTKRSPISKFNNLKSTYFTPKLLAEFLLGNSSAVIAANNLKIQNGIQNCDNGIQAHTMKYRYKSRYNFYGKRIVYNARDHQLQHLKNIRNGYTTLVAAANTNISRYKEKKLKSRQVSVLH